MDRCIRKQCRKITASEILRQPECNHSRNQWINLLLPIFKIIPKPISPCVFNLDSSPTFLTQYQRHLFPISNRSLFQSLSLHQSLPRRIQHNPSYQQSPNRQSKQTLARKQSRLLRILSRPFQQIQQQYPRCMRKHVSRRRFQNGWRKYHFNGKSVLFIKSKCSNHHHGRKYRQYLSR